MLFSVYLEFSLNLTGKSGVFKRFPQLAYLFYYEKKFKSSCFASSFSTFFIFFEFFFFFLRKLDFFTLSLLFSALFLVFFLYKKSLSVPFSPCPFYSFLPFFFICKLTPINLSLFCALPLSCACAYPAYIYNGMNAFKTTAIPRLLQSIYVNIFHFNAYMVGVYNISTRTWWGDFVFSSLKLACGKEVKKR